MDYSLSLHCTIVGGASGSGKTTFALRHMVRVKGVACQFIFDYKGEFAHRLGLPAASTAAELEAALATRWVIFNPHRMFPGQVEKAFLFFCVWVYKVCQRGPGRKILYTDEAWKYCDPYNLPIELATNIQTGRIHGLESWFLTQRPHRLNGAIRNEVTEFVCFRLQEKAAIQIAAEAGIPAEVPGNLVKGSFYSLNCDRGGFLLGRVF